MIVVSVGIDGETVLKDLNIKSVLKSGSYNYSLTPESWVGSMINELRSLNNTKINKAISLARNSTTPDNAAKKIRNIISTYKRCLDLNTERSERFKAGDESVRDIVKSYFYSEEGKEGMLPVPPVKICQHWTWTRAKKASNKWDKFDSIPRIISIEIGKDMSIGEARLFTVEVALGVSNEQPATREVFTEVSRHTVNFTMERIDD